MRARTLVALFSFFVYLLIPAHVWAASAVISEHVGVQPPFLRRTGNIIAVNDPAFFVASGTLSDILAAPVSSSDLTGNETFSMQLYTSTSQGVSPLDCKTPIESAVAWGMTLDANDPDAQTVDFGPFSGNDCVIPAATSSAGLIYARLYQGDGSAADNTTIGWEWNLNGFNFTAYADGTPLNSESSATGSSVLFLPGTEASRLYMKNPDGSDRELWEPTEASDLPALAMNADGTSVNTVYARDIVDSIYGNNQGLVGVLAHLVDPSDLEVYGNFENFLNGLAASGTIKEWRAYPYDWRYDPFDIVTNGTLTEMPDGSLQTVYLADVVKQMAATSATGKVTIVAHSNGGLLAKALVITMGPDASNYIDRIVFIGTPQFGTPSAIGGLEHADNFSDVPSLIIDSQEARVAASTMPGIYALLPSSAYFSTIMDPVSSFDPSGILSGEYAAAYGDTINSDTSLINFLGDVAGLDEHIGSPNSLRTPLPLSQTLIQKEAATHTELDDWSPPSGIRVTTIAGWGQLTTKSLAYTTKNKTECVRTNILTPAACANSAELEHAPVVTDDGDDTVVSASATSGNNDALYFDTASYRADGNGNFSHQDLVAASPVENALSELLNGIGIPSDSYLSSAKPQDGMNPLVVVSSHSPVNLLATDGEGNASGVVPVPGTDFSIKEETIPNSSVITEDDEQYIYLPQSGSYQITATGYDSGATTLDVGVVESDGSASTTAEFANIPTTASTTITFSLEAGVPIAPTTLATLSSAQAASLLQSEISALTVRPGVKNRLLSTLASGNYSYLATLIKAQTGIKLTLNQGTRFLELLNSITQSN